MQLLKFLFGIVLVEVITVSLVYISSSSQISSDLIVKLVIPLLFIALIISFWFTSITKYHNTDLVNRDEDGFRVRGGRLKKGKGRP